MPSGSCLAGSSWTTRISHQSTFSECVRAHQGAVRTFLRRLTRNTAQADDLAQQTFIRAYEQNPGLIDIEAPRSWLFKIAYRLFLDQYRKHKRREDLFDQRPDDSEAESHPGLSVDVERAMAKLEPECRAVVMLCLGYGMTHQDVARITSIPLGTVKSHVSRGKSKLRSFLAAYEAAL